MDCSPPGSCVHEIFQARILKWVAISFSRGSSRPRDWTWVSCTAGRFFTNWAKLTFKLSKKIFPLFINFQLVVGWGTSFFPSSAPNRFIMVSLMDYMRRRIIWKKQVSILITIIISGALNGPLFFTQFLNNTQLQFLGSQRVGHDWATELNWMGGHTSMALILFFLIKKVQPFFVYIYLIYFKQADGTQCCLQSYSPHVPRPIFMVTQNPDLVWHSSIIQELPLLIPLFLVGPLKTKTENAAFLKAIQAPPCPSCLIFQPAHNYNSSKSSLVLFQCCDGEGVRLYSLPSTSILFLKRRWINQLIYILNWPQIMYL